MITDPNGVLRYPLLALKILGRHPKMNPILDKIMALFYLTTLIYLWIVTLMQYQNIQGDVYKFANNFEGSTAYIQMTGKVIFTLTHKKDIIKLLEDIKFFWSIDKAEGPIKKELQAMLDYTQSILKVFFICILSTEVLIAMAPIFTKDLAVGAWTMDRNSTLFTITLCIQEIILFFMFTTFTFVVDCVFLVLFIYVIVQFRLLNSFLRNIPRKSASTPYDRRYANSLRECIEYHDFLLRYSKQLKDTVSPVMLIEYATTAVLFCTEMYMFIESNSLQESIRRPVSFCAVLFQLSFYCIPADYVTSEALGVSDAIFESDWISKYVAKTHKTIPFIMQRSQKPLHFTAGGFVNINARALVNVVRVSWSVCTILRAVKIRNQI